MSFQISVADNVKKFIEAHAEAVYPKECCGFFYGKDGDIRTITSAKRVVNSKQGDQRRRFEISAEDYRNAENFADKQDLDLLGVYHSHPEHPAKPSEHDLNQAMPFFSYIIVSVKQKKSVDFTSWRLNGEQNFEQEKILQSKHIKQ